MKIVRTEFGCLPVPRYATLGIDPSKRMSALALIMSLGKSGITKLIGYEVIDNKKKKPEEILPYMVTGQILRAAHRLLDKVAVTERVNLNIGIENNVLAGHGNFLAAQEQSMIIGAVEYSLSKCGYAPKIVHPATSKRFFTGSGKSTKDEMIAHAREHMSGWPSQSAWIRTPRREGRFLREEAVADATAAAVFAAQHVKLGEDDRDVLRCNKKNNDWFRKNGKRKDSPRQDALRVCDGDSQDTASKQDAAERDQESEDTR